MALGGGVYWLVRARPWSNGRPAAVLASGEAAESGAGPPGDRRAS